MSRDRPNYLLLILLLTPPLGWLVLLSWFVGEAIRVVVLAPVYLYYRRKAGRQAEQPRRYYRHQRT